MNVLKYKGFIGSVDFNEKDELLFGKIEGINGLVNFEGTSVKELREAFYKAVDDYLEYCKKEKIEARKSYSGTLQIRVSPDTHFQISNIANERGISINAFVKESIEKNIESYKATRRVL